MDKISQFHGVDCRNEIVVPSSQNIDRDLYIYKYAELCDISDAAEVYDISDVVDICDIRHK